MKRFDQTSIYNRLIQRLQVKEDWANILGVGTIGNLIQVISEGNAELARYLEYLYNEKKWRNARNMSSLMHLSDLISYKRQLPKSAVGHVVVSHSDIHNVERLPNYGITFFDLDQPSNFDDLVEDARASYVETTALVPWTSDSRYMIPKGTEFKTNSGITFVSLETIESRALKEPYSLIKADPAKLEDFRRAGGWNGIKYVKVPVIQGELVTIQFGLTKGRRFESFVIDSLSVENASNIVSEQFFKVELHFANTGVTETWEKIHNIRLAGPYDRVFEARVLNNENAVLIKFGDGITGRMLPTGANLVVKYIETLGSRGNVFERFQIVSMQFPAGHRMIDPRTNQQSGFLNCTNILPVMGGHDIELEEDIRQNAPPSYLQSYTISTQPSYYEQIMKNSPISLLHCKIFFSNVYETQGYGSNPTISSNFISNLNTSVSSNVLQEISMNKNILLITAIKSNGQKIDDPQNELIDPIIKAFVDVKSPSDSFDYIEPNYIEIRPNILINTTESLTENDIIAKVQPNIMNRYSIFNTDFDEPFYKSDIVDITQSSLISTYSEVFLEAKAALAPLPIVLSHRGDGKEVMNDETALLAFPFNFDKVFAQNKLNPGFKNFKVKSPYLIRADISFRSIPEKNRSLFLLDERTHLQDVITLIEAEQTPIDPSITIPIIKDVRRYDNFEEFVLFNNYAESFFNQQSRTIQFNSIERITTPTYFYQMRQFNISPVENRPLYIDESGKNKLFEREEVIPQERISLNFTTEDVGQFCYRKNTQFIEDCKIIFHENYHDTKSPQYARGFVVIPLKYVFGGAQGQTSVEMEQLGNSMTEDRDKVVMAEKMNFLLRDQFTLNVYAIPMEDNFHCENPFDIIFTARDNCLIQKQFITSK